MSSEPQNVTNESDSSSKQMPKSLKTMWDFLADVAKTQGVTAMILIYVICIGQPANQERQCAAVEAIAAKHAEAMSSVVQAFRDEQNKCDERNQELIRELFRARGFAGELKSAEDLP